MPSIKEVKNRINSIEDTHKITNAMYMISSTKLKRAKSAQEEAKPFIHTIRLYMSEILHYTHDLRNPYLDDYNDSKTRYGEDKMRAYLIYTADKGLAGDFNHNILKKAEKEISKLKKENCVLFVVGELGRQYFIGKGYDLQNSFLYTAQNPTLSRARHITTDLLTLYLNRQVDEIYQIFTDSEKEAGAGVTIEKLLPLHKENYLNDNLEDIGNGFKHDFVMEPSPKAVLKKLIPNYMASYIYWALVESYACEQAARMTAMRAANDNAIGMLKELNKTYNHIRQSGITQEITEVIGGVKALKK